MNVIVIGAGPVGLEAAVRLEDDGHAVTVLDKGAVADAVRSWEHVTLFTPWSMLTTERGRARIGATLDMSALPSGAAFRSDYLSPLAATLDVRPQNAVRSVSRAEQRKGSDIGKSARSTDGFRLLVDTPDGEVLFTADAVLDCSGVLSDPAPAGLGGVDALGERAAREAGTVRYGPVDCADLAGQRVLLVGDGASAATVLTQLSALSPPPSVTWVTAHDDLGFTSDEHDPLPGRHALYERALAARDGVDVAPRAWVTAMAQTDDGLAVTLDGRDAPVIVDTVVSCTGFRPSLDLHRELQVHSCYASEGTMKLAAALLTDAGGDCLAPKASGPELLMNPEPQFFVLGAKSYGRRNDFLLRNGHTQVDEVASLLS